MNKNGIERTPILTSFIALIVSALLLLTVIFFLRSWAGAPRFSVVDRNWGYAYAALCVIIGLLCLVKNGRVLILAMSLIVVSFLILNILGQHTLIAWLFLAWILLVSSGLGSMSVKWLGCPEKISPLERWIIFIGVGLGELALITMALGHLHLLYRAAFIAVLILLTIPLFRIIPRVPFASFFQWRKRQQAPDSAFRSAAMSIFAICLLTALVWAVAPNIKHDPLRYHLGVPTIYVQEHSIVEVPEEFRSYWAHNAEMLYTLGLSLIGQPLPGLIHLTFGLMTAALLFRIGKRIGGTYTGILASALFFCLPLVTWEGGLTDNDLTVTFYSFGAAFSVLAWWQDSDEAWLPLAGLFAGLAAAVKLTAILMLLPLSICLVCLLIARYGFSRACNLLFRRVAWVALLPAGPWLIRDWVWTGNPLFPYLNSIFKSSKWEPENTLFNFANYGNGRNLIALFRLPWDLIVHTSPYMEEAVTGFAGALPWLALPWLYLGHFKNQRRLILVTLAITISGTILWFIIGQHLRYLLVLLPTFALLSAMNLEAIRARISGQPLLQIIFFALLLSYFGATRLIHMQSSSLPERYPFRVALGLESPEAFLSRSLSAYNALRFLDRQDHGQHNVLSLGNYARVYTRARIFGIPSPSYPYWDFEDLIRMNGPALAQNGFDYLLVNRAYLREGRGMKRLYSKWTSAIHAFIMLEFSSHGYDVYRISRHRVSKHSEVDLARNAGFEEVDHNSKPVGWQFYGHIATDVENHSHSGQTAVKTLGQAWILQTVPVSPGNLYTLGAWMRSNRPAQSSVRLQIQWLDHDSNVLDTDISVDGIDISRSWKWNEISATAPDSANSAKFGIRAEERSRIWVDDFRFYERATN